MLTSSQGALNLHPTFRPALPINYLKTTITLEILGVMLARLKRYFTRDQRE